MIHPQYHRIYFVTCLVSCLFGSSLLAQSTELRQITESLIQYESLFTKEADPSLLRLELQRLLPLLPETTLDQVTHSNSVLTNSNARQAILSWWRSQDPLPASDVNERMIEHVRRVEYALDHFGCTSCDTGYDERGEIYVRYGEPERKTRVTFDDPRLIDVVFQPGVAVSPTDFPRNEFWRYFNIDRDAYFIFVEERNRYRLGDTSDLLPSVLRSGLGQGGRGQVKSKMVLAVMRSVYEQLAIEHPNFGPRFNNVDQWWMLHNDTGRLRNRDPLENAKIITGAIGLQGERPADDLEQDFSRPPNIYAQGIILDSKTEDRLASYLLSTQIPTATSDVLGVYPSLSVGMRHARFLKPDGTTTVEIYWHPDPYAFPMQAQHSDEEYLVQAYVAEQTSDYETTRSTIEAIRVQNPNRLTSISIPVQTIEMDETVGFFHLALQWDQYAYTADGIGDRLKVTSMRIDSLSALDATGITLEMSDLKPIVSKGGSQVEPWPHGWIQRGMNFGLAFEIYHLTYGIGDVTSYRITYDVARTRGRSSSTSFEFEGESRIVQEEIYLELGEKTGELVITVTVEDQTSGNEISRDLTIFLEDEQR